MGTQRAQFPGGFPHRLCPGQPQLGGRMPTPAGAPQMRSLEGLPYGSLILSLAEQVLCQTSSAVVLVHSPPVGNHLLAVAGASSATPGHRLCLWPGGGPRSVHYTGRKSITFLRRLCSHGGDRTCIPPALLSPFRFRVSLPSPDCPRRASIRPTKY